MQKENSPLRFVDGIWGRMTAWILLITWIAAMAMPDDLSYTQLPMALAMVAILTLSLVGLMTRQKLVSLPLLSWFSLAVAGYIGVRALTSYSVLEGYGDLGILLGSVVFYLAGISIAQLPRAGTWLLRALALALLFQILYWLLMNKTAIGLITVGRPDLGLAGENTRHTSLFLYKNFAGAFLFFGGAALIWFNIWARSWRYLGYSLIGIIAITLAFQCGTRAVYLLIPVTLLLGWFLWFLIRLFTQERMNWIDVIFGFGCMIGIGMGVFDLLYGTTVVGFFSGSDTHLRYEIWTHLLHILPNTPLWGHGSGAAQWEIFHLFNDWTRPNYAHNEYLQAWSDYGLIGLALLLTILVSHLAKGALVLSAEEPSKERRLAVALCSFVLLCLCITALTDFVWHQYALACTTACCCGVLTSPARRKGSFAQWIGLGRSWNELPMHEVRAQGKLGRLGLTLVILICLGTLALGIKRLAPLYIAQWQHNSQYQQHGYVSSKQYADVARQYPDYRLIEQLARVAPITGRNEWALSFKDLLKQSIEINPKNIVAVSHLVELNSYLGHFEESEQLMRRHYPKGGSDPTILFQPHVYYGLNVIYQGLRALGNGEVEKAYSMLDYGLALHEKLSLTLDYGYMPNAPKEYHGTQRPGLQELLTTATTQRDELKNLGVEKDDSWQAPQRAGESGALYKRYAPQQDRGNTTR